MTQQMTMPPLYKTAASGKRQMWSCGAAELPDGTAGYTVRYGQEHGKIQETSTAVESGKNLGRANATTPYEQAVLEAQAKWRKQLDKGYCEDGNTVQQEALFLRPMLAQSFDKHGSKIQFPCFVQPKLDGVRCLAYWHDGRVILQSRQGKPFEALPHINRHLTGILPEGVVWDGELYRHDETFQDLISFIKRKDVKPGHERVQYHVYDTFKPDNPAEPFVRRYTRAPVSDSVVRRVLNNWVQNLDGVEAAHAAATRLGYEGVMLRNCEGVYAQDKRSYDLQKVKKFIEEEFEIVGGEENVGKSAGECTLICQTSAGDRFGVKPEGTSEHRQQYWDNLSKIIGKHLTVRFFSYTTGENPVPRFPTGIAIRDYE